MSDRTSDDWIEYGKRVTLDTLLLGDGYGGDLVQLWNMIGSLGERIQELEKEVNDG